MSKPRRAPILALVVVVVAAILGLATPASAAPSSTTTTTGAGTSLGAGVSILGATITTANQPTRKLSAPHAAAFVQAWLPESIFGHPDIADPPANLPVSHVSVPYQYYGSTLRPMLMYYASDGRTAWVGMPPQSLWPGAEVTKLAWIVAPPRTIAAFAGKLLPVPVVSDTTTTRPTTTTTGTASGQAAKHGDSSSSWPWVALVVALVLVVGLAGFTARRRRARVT